MTAPRTRFAQHRAQCRRRSRVEKTPNSQLGPRGEEFRVEGAPYPAASVAAIARAKKSPRRKTMARANAPRARSARHSTARFDGTRRVFTLMGLLLRGRLLVARGASHCFQRVVLWVIYVRGHGIRFECAVVEWAREIGWPLCARVKPRRVTRWMHDERHALVDRASVGLAGAVTIAKDFSHTSPILRAVQIPANANGRSRCT